MVFQDGLRHADPERAGGLRAPAVSNHLIASGAMPLTVGVFIDPGRSPEQEPGSRRALGARTRSGTR